MRDLLAEKRSLVFLAALVLVCLAAGFAVASQATETVVPTAGSSDLPQIRLLGVFVSDAGAKALVAFNVTEEVILCEGDLVDGFTVRRIEADRVVVVRDGKEASFALANVKRLSPDLQAKTYSAAYDGENSFYPRNTEWTDRPDPSLLVQPPRLKKTSVTRPKFRHPMVGEGRVSSPLGWVSSQFGERIRPRTRYYGGGGRQFHTGIDIAAPCGTKVRASAPGTVTNTGWSWDRGRYVEVRHAGGYETRYYHLSKIYTRPGQVVKAGQTIAAEGNTGNSNGPHLHFEIRKNSVPMDPALFVRSLREVRNQR